MLSLSVCVLFFSSKHCVSSMLKMMEWLIYYLFLCFTSLIVPESYLVRIYLTWSELYIDVNDVKTIAVVNALVDLLRFFGYTFC